MSHSGTTWGLLLLSLLLALPPLRVGAVSVVVANGFEFHASMTSTSVTWILLGSNVSCVWAPSRPPPPTQQTHRALYAVSCCR